MKSILRQSKILFKAICGRSLYIRPQISIHTLRLGSEYGGWTISPDRIDEQSIVYSFGIGEDISFDLELISRYKVKVHAFDPTPKSLKWLKDQKTPKDLICYEYGIADFDGIMKFYPPDNPSHVSHTIFQRNSASMPIDVPVFKLSTIMESLGHKRIDLLKMDIEGSEYGVIDDILKSNISVTQLLIEFHDRFPQIGLQKTKDAIYTLNQAGYRIFSVSPIQEEFPFIKIK